jgi:NAD(P)-dependent dehydrogenase (short-subunit alcohol dehydrogenase family)
MDLKQKCAFITGGASGIGLAIAKSFSKAGVRIVIADIDAAALDEALRELRDGGADVCSSWLDVSDPASWRKAADEAEATMGSIQILCNNAGVGSAKSATEKIPEEYWRWIFDINFHGVRNGVATFLPRMKASGERCQILNTASILGFFARPCNSDYVATKYAVVGLSEALRMELAGTNVGVSVLCPGLVVTPLARNTGRRRPEAGSGLTAQASGVTGQVGVPVGITADAVGDIVVRALREDRFYIFTHARYCTATNRRFEEIHNSMSAAPDLGEDPAFLADGVLSLATAMGHAKN